MSPAPTHVMQTAYPGVCGGIGKGGTVITATIETALCTPLFEILHLPKK